MARWSQCTLGIFLVLAAGAWWNTSASACPFCSMQGQTLTGDVNQASLVLFGTLSNARLDPNGGFGQGATDLHIEKILKNNPILGSQKVITLPRYLPTENTTTKYLIFADAYNGKIDPYRGVPVKADSDMVKYLEGAIAHKDKDIGTRLRYFFDYLDSSDVEVSNDAYKEFGNADYNSYRELARHLPAERIARWLQDPNTPAFRIGLYASMIGHCGTAEHAALLRRMLDDPQKRLNTGIDGVLAGYTMLKPAEGWTYVRDLLRDPTREFMLRYAALRATQFFKDSRPDLVPHQQLVDGVCLLLNQSDIADLAIEDLRKWGAWEVSDQVLALYGKKSHDVPIVRRAILRFALCSPAPKAATLVAQARQQDPETVKDIEELLRLETADRAPKAAVTKKP